MTSELPKGTVCLKCGEKLKVAKYIEENCTYFYEIACACSDSATIIPVGRPLKPGSMCPNCLVGSMRQVPILEKGMRLACDSCLVAIPFGYAVKVTQ